MKGHKKGTPASVSKGGTPLTRRRQKFKDLLAAKREVVARAVSFELACQANRDDNSISAEDAVNRACDALSSATRKYLRILRKKV